MNFSNAFIPFGWPMVFYLTLAGLACGATLCAVAFLRREERARAGQSIAIVKTSLTLAIVSILLGSLFLVYDLGSSSRFLINFFEFNPSSAIAWGTRIITLFIMLCVFSLLLLNSNNRLRPVGPLLTGLLVLFALAVGIYPALVLGQATARPLWEPLLLMPLFLLLGIHTGFASVQLLTFNKWTEKSLAKIKQLDTGILFLQIILFVLLVSLTPFSTAGKQQLFSGELALWFWFGVVFIGWALPFFTSFSFPSSKRMMLLTQLCFVCGAFALRAVIVFGGQGAQAFISS